VILVLFTCLKAQWKDRKDEEVDIIASVEGRLVPFEVKYRAQATGAGDLKGLERFCADRKVDRGTSLPRT
jgi:Holliday junction resolvase-like predicted endonuclease